MKKRDACLSFAVWLAVSAAGGASCAQSSVETYMFDIDGGTLGEALDDLYAQTGIHLLYPHDLAGTTGITPVEGRYTVDVALQRLLRDTELSGRLIEGGVIVISRNNNGANASSRREAEVNERNIRRSLLAGISTLLFGAGATAQEVVLDDDTDNVDTVLVTATKRATSLQETPGSITALGAEELQQRSVKGLTDYLNAQPSVTYQDLGAGQNTIVFRGLATSTFEQSTVATYFGEVPLTNPLATFSVDMKLVDMERIEILRGPQGTLFGGGSLGGAVRNVPNAPDLSEFGGEVGFEYSHTDGAPNDNIDIDGVLNLPLIEDQLALRIVGYRESESGFVELVENDRIRGLAESVNGRVQIDDDAGSFTTSGVRSSLAWAPTDRFDVTLSYAWQEIDEDGTREVIIPLGGFRAATLDPAVPALGTQPEGRRSEAHIGSLVANLDLGWATLTASSSYINSEFEQNADLARLSDDFIAASRITTARESFTQEIRLTSATDGPLQYLIGGFYENVEFEQTQSTIWTGDPDAVFNPFGVTSDPATANLLTEETFEEAEQFAVFGEVSFDLTDALTVTAGGRWFQYDRENETMPSGVFASAPANLDTDESDAIFKAGLDYAASENAFLYATFSQGFRLGRAIPETSAGLLAICDTDSDGVHDELGIPFSSGALASDTSNNYEVGGKFSLFDNALTVNTAVFQIDWSNIPVAIGDSAGVCQVQNNGGEARSRGVEIESQVNLTDGLQLSLAGSYIDAEFRESPLFETGTRLPLSAEWNASAGLLYEFDFFGQDSFWRTDLSYISDYVTGAPGDEMVGDYIKLDMRAGVSLGATRLEAFATNLTNEDALTTSFFATRGFRLNPRTVGVSLRHQF